MLLDYLVLQNLSTSAVVVCPGSMREPHFPKQLNLELQSPWNWSMPTYVDQSHHKQLVEGSIFLLIVDDFLD